MEDRVAITNVYSLESVRYVLRGNEAAVAMFMALRDVLHFWDDLVDRDKPLTDADINRAMELVLLELPRMPFYRANFDVIHTTLVSAILNWKAATQFERTDESAAHIAYIIRSDYANILIQCAYLVGGMGWASFITPTIRKLWTNESFEEYCVNTEIERAKREEAA